jgi:hypothetical protein
LGTTGYGASATTAFSRLPPFIGSILRAAKGRLDPFAAPFGYDRYLQILLTGEDQISLTDPDSRAMAAFSKVGIPAAPIGMNEKIVTITCQGQWLARLLSSSG